VIIFVSDAFSEHYVGGAELTTEAIIDASCFPVNKVLSQTVNLGLMRKYQNCFWIFGNFAGLSHECLLYAIKNLSYSIIEYDYKFCKFRSIEKHKSLEGQCDCHEQLNGKLIATFFAKSKINFWMSEKQYQIYKNIFPFIKNNVILSSVFSDETLSYISSLDVGNKDDKWIILGSSSWIKGVDDAVSYAKENNLNYEIIWGMEYKEFLKKLANSKGLIFLPLGADTCPRLVMEAKMLGCELILNDNVQHKDEDWFRDQSFVFAYLKTRGQFFWRRIEEVAHDILDFSKTPTTSKIHFKLIIPFFNAESWLPKCLRSLKIQNYKNFKCFLIDDMSNDNSVKIANKMISKDRRFEVIKNKNKYYALENIVRTIDKADCDDEDVIILLDGDDWLATSHSLSTLANNYENHDCWVTYGSYVYNPGGQRGVEPSDYPAEVIKNNSFRTDQWRASHLRSFKYDLWKKLSHDDLKDKAGNYYKMAYDQAIMLPLLEMAGERSKFIPHVLHVYNRENSLNIDKIKASEQHQTAQEIRSKKSYTKIT